MKEDYVSFEVAKLLKEKGFDADTEHDMWYVVEKFSTGCHWNSCTYKVGDITREYDEKCCITMPTLQMAMKWLREVHNNNIVLDMIPEGDDCYVLWTFNILSNKNYKIMWGNKQPKYNTYEEACEAAIKYCLTNLI